MEESWESSPGGEDTGEGERTLQTQFGDGYGSRALPHPSPLPREREKAIPVLLTDDITQPQRF
jgi:hypothetical protein